MNFMNIFVAVAVSTSVVVGAQDVFASDNGVAFLKEKKDIWLVPKSIFPAWCQVHAQDTSGRRNGRGKRVWIA